MRGPAPAPHARTPACEACTPARPPRTSRAHALAHTKKTVPCRRQEHPPLIEGRAYPACLRRSTGPRSDALTRMLQPSCSNRSRLQLLMTSIRMRAICHRAVSAHNGVPCNLASLKSAVHPRLQLLLLVVNKMPVS